MSEIVRELVDEDLERRKDSEARLRQERLQRLDTVARHRQEIAQGSEGQLPDVVELIRQMRDERTEQIVDALRPDRD